MSEKQEVDSHGHQMIGGRGNRRWRAFWWDTDGKHSRVLGPTRAQISGKKTARGAIVWHAADGPKPDPSYLTPKEAQVELRRLLEHEARRRPTPLSVRGTPVRFGDARKAWLRHGELKRNLKRSTLKDYRQVLDAYLLPREQGEIVYGRAEFASTPLRDLTGAQGQRELFTADEDPVFAGTLGGHLDAGALRRRYVKAGERAGLRGLPFHSLRHYFGSMAVNRASLVQGQSWIGHSHIPTTARYLHAKSQAGDAALLAGAFARSPIGELDAARAERP